MKKTKNKNRNAQKKRSSHKVVESVLRPEGSLRWERFVKISHWGDTTGWMFVYTMQPVVKPGCTTALTTGLTTGCIHDTAGWQLAVYTIQPVVKPVVKLVWQPVWQQVVSCKRGFSKRFACQPQCSIAAQQLQCCTKNRIWKGLQSESSLVSHAGLS